jgi:formiminotetrahydrofolate cyclodeaminase
VSPESPRLLERHLADFLDDLESSGPIPASGAAAAIVAAMAASLVGMAARTSTGWSGAGGAAAQASALRRRLVPLALADAIAFAEALEALDEVAAGREQHEELGAKLDRAAELPLRIAEAAADVAELAAVAAECADGPSRTDAIAAAALAEGAVVAAVHLVELNLRTTPGDDRSRRGGELVAAAAASRERALGAR